MADRHQSSAGSFADWRPIIVAAAKPSRYPHFPELTCDGEWKDWSSSPDLPDDEPTSVEQPPWIRSLRTAVIDMSPKLENFLYFIHLEHADVVKFIHVGLIELAELELYDILRYEPLPQGCVRLLNLQNAEFINNLLRGLELVTIPLNAGPAYDALSYCWGDMRLCTGIFLTNQDGSECVSRVTEDLATCLVSIIQSQNLRRPTYIWVDQISINQGDTSERNSQVSYMAEIYKNASQVLVWLGQESGFRPESEILPVNPGPETDISGRTLLQWALHNSLFGRPWFSRLWVYQEVVLAKYITVLVGQQAQPWPYLADQYEHMIESLDATPNLIQVAIHSLFQPVIEAVIEARQEMTVNGHIDLNKRLPKIAMWQKCRDPRDKIFGLLGCAGDIYPTTFVDYHKPTETVYRDSARIIISKYKSLSILACYAPRSFGRGMTPRWFPQWHLFMSFGLDYTLKRASLYAASLGRVHTSSSPTDENNLDVRGKVVDAVVTDIAAFSDDYDLAIDNPARYFDVRELCRRSWTHVSNQYCLPEQGSSLYQGSRQTWPIRFIQDVIDTILCHDDVAYAPVHLDGASRNDIYYAIFQTISLREQNPSADKAFENKVMNIVCDAVSKRAGFNLARRLVVLQSGRVALVREAVRGGDVVAILHGLDTPCVLRKVEGEEKWLFIGDAFVKGLMRGEGVSWEEDEADTFTLI